MSPDAFRAAALALEGVVEGEHMHHPDFRVAGRIFATLASPDARFAMVKLPLAEQARLIEAWPEACSPAAGAWGRQGSTLILLPAARAEMVTPALELAWAASAAKPASRQSRPRPSRMR